MSPATAAIVDDIKNTVSLGDSKFRRRHRIRDLHCDPELVQTSWDLGIGDPTAIWFWQITGSEIRLIDHYENTGQAIPHYVKKINRGVTSKVSIGCRMMRNSAAQRLVARGSKRCFPWVKSLGRP